MEGLGQIWGSWKDRAQGLQKKTGLVVTPGVKFIDCRQSHLHPYLGKHRWPFCREEQFWWRRAQNGERHEWVGWQRVKKKKKRRKRKVLLCKPDGFSLNQNEQLMWKGGCSETVREKLSYEAPQAKQCPWGGKREHFYLIPDDQQTGSRVSRCMCAWWQWVSHFFMLQIQKRSLISVDEMMLNRPQEALAAWFASQAQAQYGRQW